MSSWPDSVRAAVKHLAQVGKELSSTFVGRDVAVETMMLGALCQEHTLFVGPPGTAKTQLISRFTDLIDAKGFHYLITRFTEPSELFGPLDLEGFQKGNYNLRTEGMLPESQIVFLDEVFQGSSPILNTLLTILNERLFFNGAKQQRAPLISMIGATNIVPDDPWLQAFADRFVLRVEIDRVLDEQVDDLLMRGWELERDTLESNHRAAQGQPVPKTLANLKATDLMELSYRLTEVDLGPIREEYGQVIRELRAQGVLISDRRAVKGQKLIAGAALMRESSRAETCDFWPMLHIWNRPEEKEAIQEVIQPRLDASQNNRRPESIRPVSEILDDLEVLSQRTPTVRSEAAITAHLGRLNLLRREVLKDYSKDTEARKKIDNAIHASLQRLEPSHV